MIEQNDFEFYVAPLRSAALLARNATDAVIEDAYKRAGRALTPDVAKIYSEYLAANVPGDEHAQEALIEAHTVIAALGIVPKIREDLESKAEKLAFDWLTEHRVSSRTPI